MPKREFSREQVEAQVEWSKTNLRRAMHAHTEAIYRLTQALHLVVEDLESLAQTPANQVAKATKDDEPEELTEPLF